MVFTPPDTKLQSPVSRNSQLSLLLTQEKNAVEVEIIVLSHPTAGDFMEVVHDDHLKYYSRSDSSLLLAPQLDTCCGPTSRGNRKKNFLLSLCLSK